MISWAEHNAQQEKAQARMKQEWKKYLYYSEMCDVCGHNSLSIKRKSYLSRLDTHHDASRPLIV